MARWAGAGLVLGLLPLLLAYGIRAYYLERLPHLRDVLGGGDGMLVAVVWCGTALVDLAESERGSAALRVSVVSVSWLALAFGVVAYGCLTADSVTGRVQTQGQAEFMTGLSVALLGGSAVVSAIATWLAAPKEKVGTI
jgi:hypothetical protein